MAFNVQLIPNTKAPTDVLEYMPWLNDTDEIFHILAVYRNGRLYEVFLDSGEPEDNTFIRDWSWVPRMIEEAYHMGRYDGYEDGYHDGHTRGFEDGHDHVRDVE